MIGYDKRSVYQTLLLGLTLEEMTGAEAFDRGKPHQTHTLSGVPLWSTMFDNPILVFDSTTPDFLVCPNADSGDLNFQFGDFSLLCWVYAGDLSAQRMIFCRGITDSSGWYFLVDTEGRVSLFTNQLGAHQVSSSNTNSVMINNWTLVGCTRAAGSVRIFIQGIDDTVIVGTHIAPVNAAVEDHHIGIYNDEIANPWNGSFAYPRIWGRWLSPDEMLSIYKAEHHLYGIL